MYLSTNSLGFRGEEWEKVPKRRPRIAIIGDSHAMGFGLIQEKTLGEALVRALAHRGFKAEALNFSVVGHNAKQKSAVLRKVAAQFSPDIVLLFFNTNDEGPTHWVDSQNWLRRPGSAFSWLAADPEYKFSVMGQAGLPSWLAWSQGVRALFLGRAYLQAWYGARGQKEITQSNHEPPPPARDFREEEGLAATFGPLTEAMEFCRRRGYVTVLATLENRNNYRAAYRSVAEKYGVHWVEIFSLFPKMTWDELTRTYGLGWNSHFNGEANELWAEGIAEQLEKSGKLRPFLNSSPPMN